MTVGAAVKKIVMFLLGDRKVLKKAGMTFIVLLVAIMMPVAAVTAVFSGELNIDTDELTRLVIANLSEEEKAKLTEIENTMNGIDSAMTAAGFPKRVKEAQVLYVLALYDFAGDSGFIPRLVGCFSQDQTDAQLIASVNGVFGVSISLIDFQHVMATIKDTVIDTSDYLVPGIKNSTDLVTWAVHAEEAGWGYVWGTFGTVLTRSYLNSKIKQYPDNVGVYEDFIRENWLGGRTADCVGLIKGYGWLNAETQAIEYGSNGMPDVSADGMYHNAREKGPVSTIPEIPGLAVWRPGHIGIYIGNGYVIEAMGTKYGVRKTVLKNRNFTHWLKIPYISYDPVEQLMP